MDKMVHILESGGSVILPTETVYGLFARALDQSAVRKVYELKRRSRNKAMNLNVADVETIYKFSREQPNFLNDLCQFFLPGPLTIILKANDSVPEWVNAGMPTIGFRFPNHPLTLALIKECGPFIGPSANISGSSSGTSFKSICQSFQQSFVGIQDDSYLTGKDSTILDLSGEKAKIIRQGSIVREELLRKVPSLVF